MPTMKTPMPSSQTTEEMSSLFEEVVAKAREEGRQLALKEFLRSLRALGDEVGALIDETEAALNEGGEDDEEVGEEEVTEEEEANEAPRKMALTSRARSALDFLIDHKKVTVKDLEAHLQCSNAQANLALNELVRANRAEKTFDGGRAVFRPIHVQAAA